MNGENKAQRQKNKIVNRIIQFSNNINANLYKQSEDESHEKFQRLFR